MTDEQREKIAREVLEWEPAFQHEGEPQAWTFWHKQGCNQKHGLRYSQCPAEIPHENSNDWLFPAIQALMLRGWDFDPSFRDTGEWWYSEDGWDAGHYAATLSDAINAALLEEIGE